MNTPVARHEALVHAMAKELKIPKKTINTVVAGLVAAIESELKNGKRVQIKGLGLLAVREVPVKDVEGRDAVRKRVALVAAKELKAALG